MIDSDLKYQLENINKNVGLVANKIGGNWAAFFRGLLTGLGSVVGAFIALAIIGWVLNIVGIIPAFKNQVDKWQSNLVNAQQKQIPQIGE